MQNTVGRERGERRLVLFHPKVEKKVIQNRRLSLAVILIKRPSSSSSSFYDDDASTDAGTHPYIETVSKPNDKKNGFERIRSARFARVESAKRVARVPVGAMILRVFFLFFLAGNRPTRSRVRCVWSRARKKKRGKNEAFPRVEKPRKRNRATLSRETGGERERVRVPLFVTCVLISDGFWWR